jgi:hypothetical protein
MYYIASTRRPSCQTCDRVVTRAWSTRSRATTTSLPRARRQKVLHWCETDFTSRSWLPTVGSQSLCQLCKTARLRAVLKSRFKRKGKRVLPKVAFWKWHLLARYYTHIYSLVPNYEWVGEIGAVRLRLCPRILNTVQQPWRKVTRSPEWFYTHRVSLQ